MSSKRNQTIAIARFLMYKYGLNQQLEGMTDEEYLAHPIGLEVGQYVADLMKYCPEHIVDQVMEHQDALLRRLGTDYLTVIAYMPYEEDGGQSMRDGRPNPDIWGNIITAGDRRGHLRDCRHKETWAGSAEGPCRRNPAGICDGTGCTGR